MKKHFLTVSAAAVLAATLALPAVAQNVAIVNGKAVPKARDGQLQSIRLGFKTVGQSAELATLEIADSFGQRSVLTFNRVELNVGLPASRFQFKPPAGSDVLRN